MDIIVSELRIGNLVLYSGNGTIFIVDTISDFWLNVHNEIEETGIEIDNFEPVILTQNWMIEFGLFEMGINKDKGYKDIGNGFSAYPLQSDKSKYGLYYLDEWTGITILFVHQLQNICFCLTGKELIHINKK